MREAGGSQMNQVSLRTLVRPIRPFQEQALSTAWGPGFRAHPAAGTGGMARAVPLQLRPCRGLSCPEGLPVGTLSPKARAEQTSVTPPGADLCVGGGTGHTQAKQVHSTGCPVVWTGAGEANGGEGRVEKGLQQPASRRCSGEGHGLPGSARTWQVGGGGRWGEAGSDRAGRRNIGRVELGCSSGRSRLAWQSAPVYPILTPSFPH